MPLVDYDILEWLNVCELRYFVKKFWTVKLKNKDFVFVIEQYLDVIFFLFNLNLKLEYVKNTL